LFGALACDVWSFCVWFVCFFVVNCGVVLILDLIWVKRTVVDHVFAGEGAEAHLDGKALRRESNYVLSRLAVVRWQVFAFGCMVSRCSAHFECDRYRNIRRNARWRTGWFTARNTNREITVADRARPLHRRRRDDVACLDMLLMLNAPSLFSAFPCHLAFVFDPRICWSRVV